MDTNIVLIRGTHPYMYRSGRWAIIKDVGWYNNRACYEVVFSDGKVDVWPIEDGAAGYEFESLTDDLFTKER